MAAFRSLQSRLLQPLLLLSAIAAISGVSGVYWLTSQALQKDLAQRGQLLANTLIISAETSSSLADFRRTQLAIASDPSIDRILILDLEYQTIFPNDAFDIEEHQGERAFLIDLIQRAKASGLSMGSIDPHDRDIYKVAAIITISSLPQNNVLTPKSSLLIISLHTEQARQEALLGALGLTTLFIGIGIIAFSAIYYLMNQLVLKPSQRIVSVMKAHSLKQHRETKLLPIHELGLIGQTFDQLAQELNSREQALQQALANAQEASLAKSQFLASMSHEIRTPMNGVIGMLQLLNKETINTRQRKFVDNAKASADSLLILINDILDVSKIEAGKLDIEEIDFDLIRLLEDVAASFSHRVEEKGLHLILDIETIQQPFVIGDPGRIRQILVNLIGNAIKFTHNGSITLKAHLTNKSKLTNKVAATDNQLILTCDIIDTGIGIEQSNAKQLFNSFTQADSSTTRKYGGTGLGLTIVKQLCQLMDGDIQVTSEVGQGSQFSFNVQLKLSQLTEKEIHTTPSAYMNSEQARMNIPAQKEESPKPFNLKHQKILLAEDNAINQLVAEEIITRLGLGIDICNHGQELIDKLKQSKKADYALILMDCQMPILDGYTTTKNIRQGKAGDEFKDMIIIAMTANAMQGDKEKCLAAGMNDYLSKPIDEKIIAASLSRWIVNKVTDKEMQVWDIQACKKRLNNDEQIILKVLNLFVQNVPAMIETIEASLEENKLSAVADEVHGLKGICGNLCAEELLQSCGRIETLMHSGGILAIQDYWPEFNQQYKNLRKKVEEYLAHCE